MTCAARSSTAPHAALRRHSAWRSCVLHVRPPGVAATARRLRLLSFTPAPQMSARAPAMETAEEKSGLDQHGAISTAAAVAGGPRHPVRHRAAGLSNQRGVPGDDVAGRAGLAGRKAARTLRPALAH